MKLDDFLTTLKQNPDQVEFADTMTAIEQNYQFTPTEFSNGDIVNQADQNNGSCKIFAFGQLHNLSKAHTLACFGTYYRDDVLKNPKGNDHQNIRNFISSGWDGIQFSSQVLTLLK